MSVLYGLTNQSAQMQGLTNHTREGGRAGVSAGGLNQQRRD